MTYVNGQLAITHASFTQTTYGQPIQRTSCAIQRLATKLVHIAAYQLFARTLAPTEVRVLARSPPDSITKTQVKRIAPSTSPLDSPIEVVLFGSFGCSYVDLTGIWYGPLHRSAITIPARTIGHGRPCSKFRWINATAVACTMQRPTEGAVQMSPLVPWYFSVGIAGSVSMIDEAVYFSTVEYAASVDRIRSFPAVESAMSHLLSTASQLLDPHIRIPRNGVVAVGPTDDAACSTRLHTILRFNSTNSSFIDLLDPVDTGSVSTPVIDLSATGLSVSTWLTQQSASPGGTIFSCGMDNATFIQFGFENYLTPEYTLSVHLHISSLTPSCSVASTFRKRAFTWHHFGLTVTPTGFITLYADGALIATKRCTLDTLMPMTPKFAYVNRDAFGRTRDFDLAAWSDQMTTS